MNSTIEIKLLADCQEHIPYLAKLWYEQISKIWTPNPSIEKATRNLIEHANLKELPITFVAFKQGRPVGMASLREDDGIQPDLTPWLGSLIVDPDHRQQQIGERLIDVVKDQARKFGFPKLYLLAFDQTIPKWYKKLGWNFIGMDTLYGHPVTVMETEL